MKAPKGTLRGTMTDEHQDQSTVNSEWHAKTVTANQDENASSSQCKMTEVEEVYDDEDEAVKDVYNDDVDVCDFMTKEVGSSYNSPDVNIHDKVKTSIEGEVDEEPGGNVSARSRSPRFRQTSA